MTKYLSILYCAHSSARTVNLLLSPAHGEPVQTGTLKEAACHLLLHMRPWLPPYYANCRTHYTPHYNDILLNTHPVRNKIILLRKCCKEATMVDEVAELGSCPCRCFPAFLLVSSVGDTSEVSPARTDIATAATPPV